MSTKIYNGFKFTSTNLWTIHQQLMGFRPVIYALVRQETSRFLAFHAAGNIDRLATGGEGVSSPLGSAIGDLLDRQAAVKRSGSRDPAVDFDFNVMVLPFECAVYGIVYTERSAWQRLFLEQPWVKEYAYWNNTDQPEGVTDADWEVRRDVWNRLLAQDKMDRPVGCGFAVDFVAPYFHPKAEDVLPFVPALRARAEKRAEALVRQSLVTPMYERDKAEGRASDPMAYYFEAEAEMRTAGGKAMIAAETDRIALILPEITVENLKRSPVGAANAAD